MLNAPQLQPIVEGPDPGMGPQSRQPVTLMEVEEWGDKMAVILSAKGLTALTGEDGPRVII